MLEYIFGIIVAVLATIWVVINALEEDELPDCENGIKHTGAKHCPCLICPYNRRGTYCSYYGTDKNEKWPEVSPEYKPDWCPDEADDINKLPLVLISH